MYKNLRMLTKKMIEITNEIEAYEKCKKEFVASVDRVERDYQNRRYNHDEYSKNLKKILRGKSKKEWVAYYNSYIYFLLKQIEVILSEIIRGVRQEKTVFVIR